MKSFTGTFTSVRGWALLLALLLGAGMMISACGEEDTPAPTTPTPTPAPAPAPTPEPEPTGPAVPTGLKATVGAGYIEWSWNTVEGAFGYQGQFSPDLQFTDADPKFLIVAPKTSHRVHNQTTGHFRVRSGTGTSVTDLEFSDWSTVVRGVADPVPAPAATPLETPGNVRTSARQDTSITVAWDSVADAEAYDVQQQAGGAGSWSSARCGTGGRSQVTETSCVASGLSRGTQYGFRVRAVPAASDTGSAPSAWSATASAATTGRPAVTIEDGGLNLRWSSEWDDSESITDSHAITWRWDPVEDRALQPLMDHYVSLLHPNRTGGSRGERECPALDRNVVSTETVSDSETNYGKWLNLDSDIAVAVRGVGGSDGSDDAGDHGEVRGLCVVRTWEDSTGLRQFGDVSLAWATTLPNSVSADNPLNRENKVSRLTTSINWDYQIDTGFTYEVRLLSTSRDNDAPSDVANCSGGQSVRSPRDVETYDFPASYRLQSVAPYTNYRLCIRAENDRGASEWAFVGGDAAASYANATAVTRPVAPSAPTYDSGESEVATEAYGGHDVDRMVWSVRHKAGTPLNGTPATASRGGHEYKILRKTTGGSIRGSAIQDTCEDGDHLGNELSPDVPATARNFGDGFEIQMEADIVSNANSAIANKPDAYYIYACVRADPTSGSDDDHGPWSISSPNAFAAGLPSDLGSLSFTTSATGTTTKTHTLTWTWDKPDNATDDGARYAVERIELTSGETLSAALFTDGRTVTRKSLSNASTREYEFTATTTATSSTKRYAVRVAYTERHVSKTLTPTTKWSAPLAGTVNHE